MLLTRFAAATPVAIGMVALLAHGALAGSRPPPGPPFIGRFEGKGSNTSYVTIDSGPAGTYIRNMGGFLPSPCRVRGVTRLPGRDGAIGLQFDLSHERSRTTGRSIKEDGTFAFRVDRRGTAYDPSYTVWIRGTFSGKVVRGHVKGTSRGDPLQGACDGSRSFTARRK